MSNFEIRAMNQNSILSSKNLIHKRTVRELANLIGKPFLQQLILFYFFNIYI
jgi:hypothetical protein